MRDLWARPRFAARAGALLFALTLLVAPASGAQRKPSATSATGPSFEELYSRGQKANAGITTLTARFVETTTPSLLTRPIVERGVLYVQRPSRRVAIRYTDPPDRVVLIDGDRMVTSWPSRKIRDTRDIGATQQRIQKYFDDSDAAELRKVFDIELRDRSERPGMRELAMVPKRKQIRENLAKLELWVEESSGLLHAMRMTFSNGDTKLMEFTDVVPNAQIPSEAFRAPG
ncbi:MAG TPA: outer membrane lipoprotein carrier protein LolA [Vicinamibacterales bacterium]|nr:outer membrane lipoprotein carrier protein LolA [Vicinamibacterales bacterium]